MATLALPYHAPMRSFPALLAAFLALAASSAALAQTPDQPAAPASAASSPQPAAAQPVPAASQAAPSKPKAAPPQSALTAPLMYQLLLGEFTFRQGTPESAQSGFEIMLDAARRTGDQRLFRRATEMALQARSGPNALAAARAWRAALPQSPDANRYELQVLIALGRIQETAMPLRRALETLPAAEREDFVLTLPAFYRHAADKALVRQTVERALADTLKSPRLAPAAWASIGRLRLQAGDTDGALNAAMLGAASNAQVNAPSPWPALLALQLMADANTPQTKTSAETLVKQYLQTPAAKPEAQLGYARVLTDAGRPQQALAQLEQLTQRQPDYPDGWLALGAARAGQGQTSPAEAALERYLDMAARHADQPAGKSGDAPPKTADPQAVRQRLADMDTARLMLAQLAQKRGDAKAADQWLAAVQSPGQMLAVAAERATLLADQGRLEEGRALIRAVPERRPDDAVLKLRAEARLLRDHQHAADAYKLLDGALQGNPDDKDLVYDAAMAAAKAGQMDDEERLLRHLIALDPQSPVPYNALGYDLADRGQRLDQAKELIEKAVALAPDDAFIRDSLGWVNYRLGNLPEARRLLESAFKQQPDAEIAAHLGEVLWAQDEHDAARAIWRKGLSLDAKNETLQKTLKRFKIEQP
jgi:tetratricopeptide (TPR) repeat protein